MLLSISLKEKNTTETQKNYKLVGYKKAAKLRKKPTLGKDMGGLCQAARNSLLPL